MSSPAGAIQAALYNRLVSDSTLMGMITGVFDHVPEDEIHPYVTLGEGTEIPDNALSELGKENTQTLHAWVRERGTKTGQDILNRVSQLLDQQPLSVGGHHLVAVRFEYAETLRDPDPEIRHVVMRFRILTEEPA